MDRAWRFLSPSNSLSLSLSLCLRILNAVLLNKLSPSDGSVSTNKKRRGGDFSKEKIKGHHKVSKGREKRVGSAAAQLFNMNFGPRSALQFQLTAQKTKRLLLRRSGSSVNGIRSLSRSLGIADDLGGQQITREQLRAALGENGVELEGCDYDSIFTQLDRSGSGTIEPTEFIAAMRSDMNPLRRVWLRRVWNLFSKDAQGSVSVAELQRLYRPDEHPAVKRGEQTADAVRAEFESTFNATTNPDGRVSRQEFEQYYTGYSSACLDDETFTATLRGVWPIPGVSKEYSESLAAGTARYKEAYYTNQSLDKKASVAYKERLRAELLRVITDEHRPVTISSARTSRIFCRHLLSLAKEDNGFILPSDFLEVLRCHRLYVADPAILAILDTNGDGKVDAFYYIELLLPQLPPARQMMMERLWVTVFNPSDPLSRISVHTLHDKFQCDDAEKKDAFLSSWDVREALQGKVQFEELVQWYLPQSLSLQRDVDFETLLCRNWPEYKNKCC